MNGVAPALMVDNFSRFAHSNAPTLECDLDVADEYIRPRPRSRVYGSTRSVRTAFPRAQGAPGVRNE